MTANFIGFCILIPAAFLIGMAIGFAGKEDAAEERALVKFRREAVRMGAGVWATIADGSVVFKWRV